MDTFNLLSHINIFITSVFWAFGSFHLSCVRNVSLKFQSQICFFPNQMWWLSFVENYSFGIMGNRNLFVLKFEFQVVTNDYNFLFFSMSGHIHRLWIDFKIDDQRPWNSQTVLKTNICTFLHVNWTNNLNIHIVLLKMNKFQSFNACLGYRNVYT